MRVLAPTALALVLASSAGAQVAMQLRFEHPSVLVGESVNAFLVIANRSGGTLVVNEIGGSNLEIGFRVVRDARRDETIPRSNERFLIPNLMLRDGEAGEYLVDLARTFDIGAEGSYLVQAEAQYRGVVLRSNLVSVDLVNGIEIASTDVVLRDYERMVRRCTLRYWKRGGKEHLFLRVDEPDTPALRGVFDLGFLVRVFRPVIRADSSGRIVVLHQSGPTRYTRTEFVSGPSDVRFVDQRYMRADGSPAHPNVWRDEDLATNRLFAADQPQAEKKRSWLSRWFPVKSTSRPTTTKKQTRHEAHTP